MSGWASTFTQAASSFAIPAFKEQWAAGEAIAPNFWGPLEMAKEKQLERYDGNATAPLCPPSGPCPTTVPLSERTVQYFDKGRMEITRGAVTNGLLATEIVTGRVQLGDATFEQHAPPAIPIAGDPDNAGVTYAALAAKGQQLLAAASDGTNGGTVAVSLSTSGDVVATPKAATPPPAYSFTAFDAATRHNVAKAFADYRGRAGLDTIGYAISEPFVAIVKVAGAQRTVLIEVFERRVLTYTADNPLAFQVEMGNIGQHYYQWRYAAPSPSPTAPAATTAAATTAPANVLGNAPAAPIRPGVPPANADSCPIIYPVKGATQGGAKVYDTPGSPTYAGTKPEICFLSPADADAAGYHAIKR